MDMGLRSFLQGIFEGYPILFLGSGFSVQATNGEGRSLPTGLGLAEMLKTKAALNSDYPLDIVAREFAEKFGENGLFDFLRRNLIATKISSTQARIISLPWRRIYTTNYDNVVELAAKQFQRKIASVTLRDKVDHSRSLVQCVHLNGQLEATSLQTFSQEIKLTRASYLTDAFVNSAWLTTFRNDLALASSIIFVGYSMYDIDVARIVYEDPMLKAKTCFVDTVELDPVFARELQQFGHVFPVGLDKFAENASDYSDKPVQSENLTAFSQYSMPDMVRQPTGDSIISLFVRGQIEDETILGSYASKSNYVVGRAALGDLISRIQSGKRRFVIHADLGNGKSVFLHLIRLALAQAGYRVLQLKQSFDTADEDIRLIAASGGNDIIIIEELYRNKETINKICFAAPNSTVIVTSRTSLFGLHPVPKTPS